MRRITFLLLSLLLCAFVYAQPVLKLPVNSKTSAMTSPQPYFKMTKVTGAIGYEIYLTSVMSDTGNSSIPVTSTVDHSKRYRTVQLGADSSYTLSDTVLAKNTVYGWKVRTKTGTSTFSAWSKYSFFLTPSQFVSVTFPVAGSLTQGPHYVIWNNYTGVAVKKVALSLDSGSVYQTAINVNSAAVTDSALVDFQGGSSPTSSCFVRVLTAADADTAKSALFTLKFVSVASQGAGSQALGQHYVIWHNFTGNGVTKVALSLDSGATYLTPTNVSSSTSLKDSVLFDFQGGLSASNKCFIKIMTASDTAISAFFALTGFEVVSPAGGALSQGKQYVVWNNYTGHPVANVALSLDSGVTYLTPTAVASSTALRDSILFDYQGAGSTTSDCFMKVLTAGDADNAVSSYFTLKFLSVTSPTTGTVTTGQHYVVWYNFTGAAVKKVALSIDGTTYLPYTSVNTSAIKDSVQFDFAGGRNTSSACRIRILTAADADTGKSAAFTMNGAGATFSIPPTYGDPGSIVSVPINVVDYVSADSVKAFDVKVTFDTAKVKFKYFAVHSSLANWLVDTGFANTGSAFARIAAFKMPTAEGVKNSEIVRLVFSINSYSSLIGASAALGLDMSVLSAAGGNALSLDVSASTSGTLKVYSSIAGNIRYLHEKWDGSPSYPISGDSLITYYDSSNTANNSKWDVVAGNYRMSSREPDDTVNFYPVVSVYPGNNGAIDVADARKAFGAWHDTTMSTRAMIAADVNEDGIVNASDAMAIMEINVDSTYLTRVGLSNWMFIDSTSLASFESASDSMTGWFAKHQHSISYKLHNQMNNQNFFGVLRGDVNFDYVSAPVTGLGKSATVPVLFSTGSSIEVRQGDDVWIPLNITPGDKNEIGGFDASMHVDPQILSYAGEFKKGPTMPQTGNWYITGKCDAQGTLKVAAIDFAQTISPIVREGSALLFKYIVNKAARLGAAGDIAIQVQSVYSKSMQKISSVTSNGKVEVSGLASGIGTAAVIKSYALAQNYPNPFNPSTMIEYALPKESKVVVTIYNILGLQVAALFSGVQAPGYHQILWNAANLSSGVYFYEMKASSVSDGEKFQAVRRLTLLK